MHPSSPEIYTLSLHDALPISITYFFNKVFWIHIALGISIEHFCVFFFYFRDNLVNISKIKTDFRRMILTKLRSEEHTSELQSRQYIVCRLLLEKKNSTETTQK